MQVNTQISSIRQCARWGICPVGTVLSSLALDQPAGGRQYRGLERRR